MLASLVQRCILLIVLVTCCVAILPNNQTSQTPNLQGDEEPLVIDDSDDTDVERGSDVVDDDDDDDDDGHVNGVNYICERLRRRAEETMYITRALEMIDDRHHTAWSSVRHCLERLVQLFSNNPLSRRDLEAVDQTFLELRGRIEQLPDHLRERFHPFFVRMRAFATRRNQQRQQPRQGQQQQQQQTSPPLPQGSRPPPSVRVLPAWMQREVTMTTVPTTSTSAPVRREEEEDEENIPPSLTQSSSSGHAIRQPSVITSHTQNQHFPSSLTRANILRRSHGNLQRQRQQQQQQQRPMQRPREEEEEDVFAFPPRPTRPVPPVMTGHNRQQNMVQSAPTAPATAAATVAPATTSATTDQRSFWGLCGHCCGILQHSGGFCPQNHLSSSLIMDRVDRYIRTRATVDRECDWSDNRGANLIRRWMRMLRNMLVFTSYFLARTNTVQQAALAAVVWRELHNSLSEYLQSDNLLMRECADENGVGDFNIEVNTRPSSPEPPADNPPECVICMDAKPTVVLIPCGHTFCGPCVEGLGRCPTCRALFQAKYNIFY